MNLRKIPGSMFLTEIQRNENVLFSRKGRFLSETSADWTREVFL